MQSYFYQHIYQNLEPTEQQQVLLIQKGDEQAFEKVFSTYYKPLHAYAFAIIKDKMVAEEIVQEVFYKIWLRKNNLKIQSSLKAYLYAAVFNESMDCIKKRKKIIVSQLQPVYTNEEGISADDAGSKTGMRELEEQLQKALNDLPEQCRTVFQLSRFEQLKYHDIADQLGLSIKTIEAQMGKALKRLRIALAEFLPVLILLLLWN